MNRNKVDSRNIESRIHKFQTFESFIQRFKDCTLRMLNSLKVHTECYTNVEISGPDKQRMTSSTVGDEFIKFAECI